MSPLIGTEKRHFLSVLSGAVHLCKMHDLPAEQVIEAPYRDRDNLERMIFDRAPVHEPPQPLAMPVYRLTTASNEVARKSRRGFANHFFLNASTLMKIGASNDADYLLSIRYNFYLRSWIPDEIVMCAYIGTHEEDRPAAYFDGKLYLNYDNALFYRVNTVHITQ